MSSFPLRSARHTYPKDAGLAGERIHPSPPSSLARGRGDVGLPSPHGERLARSREGGNRSQCQHEDRDHRRGQRRLHAKARHRRALRAGASGHRDRADRHQRAQSRHGARRSSRRSSRSTGCRRASRPRPTGAGRSKARATSSIACASAGSRPSPTTSAFPLQYGVDQCVGDTICAGGILYGQRSIPAILDFCNDIREVCEPRARLLNYANPMAMNTWAAIDHGKVETIGLCHGDPARLAADRRGARRRRPARGRIHLLRHQSPDLVHRRAFSRPAHRPRRAGRGVRAPSCLFAAGEGADRRPQALRRLFDREQRAPVGISALVPQAAGRDRPLDRHVGMDPRRDRRLSAPLHRDAQLVRDRISRLSRRGQEADRSRRRAPTSTRATSSRRWRPAGPIAAIST